VAWQDGSNQRSISRVKDLNIGGLFIVTPNPLPLGTAVTILLSVPEGEIRSSAIVRNTVSNEGMGVQLSEIGLTDNERLQKLVTRLLRTTPAGT